MTMHIVEKILKNRHMELVKHRLYMPFQICVILEIKMRHHMK